MGVGIYYNHDTGKKATVYRDIPPKVTEFMANSLVHHYKPFIAQILIWAKQEAARAEELIREGFKQAV